MGCTAVIVRPTSSARRLAQSMPTVAHWNQGPIVFNFDRQEGRTFWGVLSSAKVSEKVIGAISGDGKRFVMVDEDGRFDGLVVDNDTLDYCYAHITTTDRAVACGLLIRDKK